MRLDEDDPVAAWREHVTKLGARANLLNDMRIDSLRYRGPGTDLTVGLLPESRWQGCESTNGTGVNYVANMPTEEVFTTPDRRRTEGTARSTQPLVLAGQIVKGLEVSVRERSHRRRSRRRRRERDRRRARDRRERTVPRRGRPRRRNVTRRSDRPRVLRDALRRERLVPRRVRQRVRRGSRGRRHRRRQRLERAHRLHDRRRRASRWTLCCATAVWFHSCGEDEWQLRH